MDLTAAILYNNKLHRKMKLKYGKEEEIQMIRYLCFRQQDPRTSKVTYMAQTDVAKLISRSPAYVQRVCRDLRNGFPLDLMELGQIRQGDQNVTHPGQGSTPA